jgi:hypothetical protein
MPRLDRRFATITQLDRADGEIIHARATADGESIERRVIAYPRLTGPIGVGSRVCLNTTATALSLGTGGVDFVVSVEESQESQVLSVLGAVLGDEHVLKLRYTPSQHAVSCSELSDAWPSDPNANLEAMPVVVGILHSQIAPAAAAIKALRPEAKIAYLMTDSAALPMAFSELVRTLRQANLLNATITSGQGFGGDFECVTIPSAMIAARHLARADVLLVAPGPGNAGTGTRYGFSGIEQAWILDIAHALGGTAIAQLRISLADQRARHQGISHHSVTALSLCQKRHRAALPTGFDLDFEPDRKTINAELLWADGASGIALLESLEVRLTSMGRKIADDPIFFHAAAAAGALAVDLLKL